MRKGGIEDAVRADKSIRLGTKQSFRTVITKLAGIHLVYGSANGNGRAAERLYW